MDLEVNISVTDLIFALVIEQLFQVYLVTTTTLNRILFFFTFIMALFFYIRYQEWNALLREHDDIEIHVIANVIFDVLGLFFMYQLVSSINSTIANYYLWFTISMAIAAIWHAGHILYYHHVPDLLTHNIENIFRDIAVFLILLIIGVAFPLMDDLTRIVLMIATFTFSGILTVQMNRKAKTKRLIQSG